MREEAKLYCFLFCVCFLVVGCGPPPAQPAAADAPPPARESRESPEVPTPAPPVPSEPRVPASEPAEEPRPAPVDEVPGPDAPEAPPAGSSMAEPAPPPASPPAGADAPAVVDVGGPVEIGETRPGLSRIGAEKCKLCHKVQFASWAETAHASRTPPLDCEGCHGPGSEYKGMAVMKDPVKARAAGLVDPDRAFCSQCHVAGWTDDLLKRSHAHDVGDSG